ncbi:ATP phosphoribosyltransferase regulatory subunit [Butyricicoccus pullicaecorum DSM 23266]|uniref:Multifunctional fusion protein n=1 Tax=Butyricicoccus pullicaecorum 1.2 TaxID=1203606 RepID=R8W3Z2_9FIRM|nr:ATP phosphoribosyltransferase, regulatory subunit [Butyricicoccus pullicaecorum 1.2]SKA60493.1 ATP phosphoribosyltransferase regulatory subunit [Butyricicoccus pullicaecorum DSM 23266]
MNRYQISTPEGTRDLLFAPARRLRAVEQRVRQSLEDRGYSEVITPAIEYYDVFAQANPAVGQENMLKIVDRAGRICVARPDNTTPIARIAATRLEGAELPVRLYYSQKVFRSIAEGHGHKSEFLQVGAELIGSDGLEADLDILTAAFSALEQAEAGSFRIELGHAEIYKALIEALGVDEQTAEDIRRLIENKSFAALGDALAPYQGSAAYQALCAMPQLFGGVEVLDQVEHMTGNMRVLAAVAYLRRVYTALEQAGFGESVIIDLGLVHEMDYYTGIMFRGYLGGAGAAILAGGRYNALCAKFGRDLPAAGFGIDVERIAETGSEADNRQVRDTIRIALTKGRLEKKTLARMKAAGYDISELESPSRKLIFRLPDTNIEVVLAKAADVITYVEHGVCDLGVVGKDTIMEKGGSFYEMVDLGFGKCRFALATKKGKTVYGNYRTPVIATKYPEVTRAFFSRKNMDVETIKIEGSVELAPLLELADAIVDIVETGSTLKENGLEVIEDVAPISARVIVNLASAKMNKTAIQRIISDLERGGEEQ